MVVAADNWLAPVTFLAAVLVPTTILASVADNYVDPLLIWGGSDCTTTASMELCTGYSPAGLILIALAVTAVLSVAIGAIQLRRNSDEADA